MSQMAQSVIEEDRMERGEVSDSEANADLDALTRIQSAGASNGTTKGENGSLSVEYDSSQKPYSHPWRDALQPFTQFRNLFRSRQEPHIVARKPFVRSLEQCPEGYPRLAAFLDSDENFMLYRRFGFLQARILLYKQDELRELEYELDRMDRIDAKQAPEVLRSRDEDDARHERRKKLICDTSEKFKEYAELLVVSQGLATFNRPSAQDYQSVKSYFDEEAPLCNVESYIYSKEDLITLKSGRDSAWLDAAIAKLLQILGCRFNRYLFCSKDIRQKADPETTRVVLYSRDRVEFAVSLITTMTILALLMIPVYLLWQLTRSPQPGSATGMIFGVLLAFTLLFAGVLALFTRAKRHEIFASSAAYCAVLVVFMSNVGQLTPGAKN